MLRAFVLLTLLSACAPPEAPSANRIAMPTRTYLCRGNDQIVRVTTSDGETIELATGDPCGTPHQGLLDYRNYLKRTDV